MSGRLMASIDFQTKTQKALQSYRNGDLKEALHIFKDFTRAFRKEEIRTIQVAYEILFGKGEFYEKLHYDLQKFVSDSIDIINKKFNIINNEEDIPQA